MESSLNALIFEVSGTCGPRQKSMNCGPERVFGEDLAGLSSISSHFIQASAYFCRPSSFAVYDALVGEVARLDLPHLLLDLFEIFGSERAWRGRNRSRSRSRWADRCRAWSRDTVRARRRPAGARWSGDRLRALRDPWWSGSASVASFSSGRVRSYSSPLTLATMAASARRGLIDLAMSMGRVPAATDCLLPSGRVISMLLIGKFQRNTGDAMPRSARIGQAAAVRGVAGYDGRTALMAVSSQAGIDESHTGRASRAKAIPRAFGELVRRYEGKIFRLAQHVTQNREDAEDVLQETFMKAYEHLDQFKGDSKFYTWIVRIAVNQALMKLRRRKTDKSVSLDETDRYRRRHGGARDRGLGRGSRAALLPRGTGRDSGHGRPESGAALPIAFSCCATSKNFRPKRRPRRSDLSVPAVKSRLLRARLQLREKLTRFFKRKGDDAFAYM